MKKHLLLPTFIALLIIVIGVGGIIRARTPLSNQKSSTLLANPQPSETISASLYLTGTRVIPTVAISPSTANCDPKNIPHPASNDTNIGPTIKPHLCSIPTFTEQDVRQYMSTIHSFSGMRIQQVSSRFTVTRVLFVTNKVANDILNADTGSIDDSLIVCYVEVYGDFTVASPFSTSNKQKFLHHGQMVFDGVTGQMLVMGVEA